MLALSGLSFLSLGILLTIVLILYSQASEQAANECLTLSSRILDDNVRGLQAMCLTQHESQGLTIESTLRVADQLIQNGGGLHYGGNDRGWLNAVNQFSSEKIVMSLPRVRLGKDRLGRTQPEYPFTTGR